MIESNRRYMMRKGFFEGVMIIIMLFFQDNVFDYYFFRFLFGFIIIVLQIKRMI